MLEINDNVVFVEGAKNGAIYNLNNGNVYSISAESCQALRKQISHEKLNEEEQEYFLLLTNKGLLSNTFSMKDYVPEKREEKLKTCWLEITEQCNCKCVHCYEGQTHGKKKNSLSLTEWKQVVDQLKETAVDNIIVIGGEPCIHPDITEIMSYIAEKHMSATLFTNGTLISDELRNIILKEKFRLKFSLYGHCAEVHDKISRRNGSFKLLTDNILFFVRHGIDVNISIVIMHENEEYYHEIVEFVKTLGVRDYKIDVIREVFGGTQNDHVPKLQEIVDLKKRKKAHFPKVTKEKFDRAFYENTCWCGKLVISEDGIVLPCVFERETILGNIRDHSIEEIMKSSPTKQCWEHCFEKIDECRDCEFRFACKDCRPLAKGVSGNVNARNPRCMYDVYEGVWR